MRRDLDLLVVGAGPTGLALAIEAARHGLTARIVDQAAAPSIHSKALAVQPRTLEILESWGVAEAAVAVGRSVGAFRFHVDGGSPGRIALEDLPSRYRAILVLPQSDLERLLIERLERFGGRVEREAALTGFTVEGGGVTATLQRAAGGETVRARWLAGCDGAHSTVRHLLDLPFEGAAYPEEFLLADVRVEWDVARDEGHAFLVEGDPAVAAVPMVGRDRWRLIVPLTGDAERRAGNDPGAEPSLEELEAILRRAAGVEARLSDPEWLSRFRIHRRIVPRFRSGPVFLLGDAAHIHSPIGGQGMNTGIQDAWNLGWKMGLVAAPAAGEGLLDSYDLERRKVAERVLAATDLAQRTLLGRSLAARLARRVAPRLLLASRTLRSRAARLVSQLAVSYRESPIVAEAPGAAFHGGPAAGERAPDGRLSTGGSARREQAVFAALRGPRHVLLGFLPADRADLGDRASAVLVDLPACLRGALAGRFRARWVVGARGYTDGAGPSPGASVFDDPAGSVRERYGVNDRGALYLVRPDGHVAWRGSLDPAPLVRFLDRYR